MKYPYNYNFGDISIFGVDTTSNKWGVSILIGYKLTQNMVQWWALVNMAINRWVPQTSRNL
jgi:hypothetical protein